MWKKIDTYVHLVTQTGFIFCRCYLRYNYRANLPNGIFQLFKMGIKYVYNCNIFGVIILVLVGEGTVQ